MTDCIFCRIIAGQIPSYKIYEDNLFFGFLDINPLTKGHSLIIPKKHYRWTYEVPEFQEYWLAVLKSTRKIEKALKPKWISYLTHGLVPHAHIHILPRYEAVESAAFIPSDNPKMTKKEFTEISNSIFDC